MRQCSDRGHNLVLLYKKQGEIDNLNNLCVNDFCLIIMTEFQKTMLKKFGQNIIAIDGTHGLNNYDFELSSVLVVDEFGEGVPVVFMFSNRKDTYIYQLCFRVVKLNVGSISPNTFMTDIVSTYYNAWLHIMGPVEHQLYCAWHVDRAWQQNLSKIRDKGKRSNVYKSLKVLQQDITEPDVFVGCLGNILTSLLLDKDTYDFGIYFQNNYNLNYQQWAYCFRKGCGINTNMRLESMHKVIKYFYLEGKKVKRLDRSLHVLKYLRDKSVDRIIKKTKGKYTQHTSGIIKRHRIAALS